MSLMPLGLLSQGGGAGAAANALTLISTANGNGSSGDIVFSSIPSTYKHLQIRFTSRGAFAGTISDLGLYVNNNFGAIYTNHQLVGNGSTVSSANLTGQTTVTLINSTTGSSATASSFSSGIIDILDYSQTTKNKTFRMLSGEHTASPRVQLVSGLAETTTAISSIGLFIAAGGAFAVGTRFSLYGVS